MLVYKFLKEIIELKVSCLSSDYITSLELKFRKVYTFWKQRVILSFISCLTQAFKTRMHSSRICTARSSSRHGHGWAWTRSPSTSPFGVGLGPPPSQILLNFSLGCGPGNLQGMLGPDPPGPEQFYWFFVRYLHYFCILYPSWYCTYVHVQLCIFTFHEDCRCKNYC